MIRLKLHLFYKEERDTAATRKEAADPNEYILSSKEIENLMQANMTLARFYQLLAEFQKTGGKSGLSAKKSYWPF